MLFILEKCDMLLEKRLFEQFKADLCFITENCINVKFLLITNKDEKLNVGESVVWMRELRKLDAAKLLCKNAYNFLMYNERNIYELIQHPIFDAIPLTPQGIGFICEKLKNGKNLDQIEREL